jgi:pyruvate/2-oxoglutarate dehydrogenase complex dihydrolipoamide acyltransferase (E2) component
LQFYLRGGRPQGEEVMLKSKTARRGLYLSMIVLFLAPLGSAALAATRATAESVVTSAELYTAISVQNGEEAAARKSVQNVLARPEVRQVAARAGVDLDRAQVVVSALSGEDLQAVADQAQRVDETLAGGSSIVVTSTAVIIGLLILIVLIVAR